MDTSELIQLGEHNTRMGAIESSLRTAVENETSSSTCMVRYLNLDKASSFFTRSVDDGDGDFLEERVAYGDRKSLLTSLVSFRRRIPKQKGDRLPGDRIEKEDMVFPAKVCSGVHSHRQPVAPYLTTSCKPSGWRM